MILVVGRWPCQHCRWPSDVSYTVANTSLANSFAEERAMLLRAIAISLCLGCLPGIATVQADQGSIPADITVQYNVRYREGASPSWVLDLAMPKAAAEKPRAAIVVIHGGGWIEGSRSSFSGANDRRPGHIFDFAQHGYVAVTIDYRLAKAAPFPAAVEDCKCAVRWLRANREKYNIDPERIGVWGNSAGGHLALMLALVDKSAGLEGDGPYQDESSAVQAAVSDSGPIDLAYQYEHKQVHTAIHAFLNGPPEGDRLAEYRRASPRSYLAAKLPPLMLIYGGFDTQVGIETADHFLEALRQGGAKDLSYLRLGTADHCPYSLIRVPWLVPAVDEFFERTLKRGH
jgi:acetyl esterase/lipase